jgi:hypothetical protein
MSSEKVTVSRDGISQEKLHFAIIALEQLQTIYDYTILLLPPLHHHKKKPCL